MRVAWCRCGPRAPSTKGTQPSEVARGILDRRDAGRSPRVVRGKRDLRIPAAPVQVRFDVDPASGQGLDDLLLDEAVRDPAGTSLLEFVLDDPWRHRANDPRAPGGLLTLAHYRNALGELAGAIGRRAEDVFTGVVGDPPSPARTAALEHVFNALVAVDEQGVAARRRTPIDTWKPGTAERALVDALVDARLLWSATAAGPTSPSSASPTTRWSGRAGHGGGWASCSTRASLAPMARRPPTGTGRPTTFAAPPAPGWLRWSSTPGRPRFLRRARATACLSWTRRAPPPRHSFRNRRSVANGRSNATGGEP